jgi:hypothetical protein
MGAVADHTVDFKLIATTQAEPSTYGATADSPITCRSEWYISPAENT